MRERSIDDKMMALVSREWLAYQDDEDPQYAWALDEKAEWFSQHDYSTMERFVLQVCRDVDPEAESLVGMIGASLLEDLISEFPDQALDFLERAVETNVVLREALAGVWLTSEPLVRARIDAILARYGENESG